KARYAAATGGTLGPSICCGNPSDGDQGVYSWSGRLDPTLAHPIHWTTTERVIL
ncbi:hypothetical protein GGI08_008921, partial [Coemansia sp. S2]